jgi:hypothetical protein
LALAPCELPTVSTKLIHVVLLEDVLLISGQSVSQA